MISIKIPLFLSIIGLFFHNWTIFDWNRWLMSKFARLLGVFCLMNQIRFNIWIRTNFLCIFFKMNQILTLVGRLHSLQGQIYSDSVVVGNLFTVACLHQMTHIQSGNISKKQCCASYKFILSFAKKNQPLNHARLPLS